MSGGLHFAEGFGCWLGVAAGAGGGLDDRGDLALERVEERVATGPLVGQCVVVESVEAAFGFEPGNEWRPGRQQQSDRVLDGLDVLDEAVLLDEGEQVEEVGGGGPGGVGDPSGTDDQAGILGGSERAIEVCADVALREVLQDGVVRRFEGGGDEDGAVVAEAGEYRGVFE